MNTARDTAALLLARLAPDDPLRPRVEMIQRHLQAADRLTAPTPGWLWFVAAGIAALGAGITWLPHLVPAATGFVGSLTGNLLGRMVSNRRPRVLLTGLELNEKRPRVLVTSLAPGELALRLLDHIRLAHRTAHRGRHHLAHALGQAAIVVESLRGAPPPDLPRLTVQKGLTERVHALLHDTCDDRYATTARLAAHARCAEALGAAAPTDRVPPRTGTPLAAGLLVGTSFVLYDTLGPALIPAYAIVIAALILGRLDSRCRLPAQATDPDALRTELPAVLKPLIPEAWR